MAATFLAIRYVLYHFPSIAVTSFGGYEKTTRLGWLRVLCFCVLLSFFGVFLFWTSRFAGTAHKIILGVKIILPYDDEGNSYNERCQNPALYTKTTSVYKIIFRKHGVNNAFGVDAADWHSKYYALENIPCNMVTNAHPDVAGFPVDVCE